MSQDPPPVDATEPAKPVLPPTPLRWRLAIAGTVLVLAVLAVIFEEALGPRQQALLGIVCFVGLAAALSANLRAVSWRTMAGGLTLQVLLALFVIRFEVAGYRPGYELFAAAGAAIQQFLEFTNQGARFVFGVLADPGAMDQAFPKRGFVFAFSALPVIVFVSSFFTLLYHFGVLQFIVRLLAKGMVAVIGASGAESLSAAANVFMGQTEAPLIVKPYIQTMTQSELLALMVGGMATVSGGLMAVYIQMGADPVAILATSVMAAPCGLYLSKLVLPETEEPLTRGEVRLVVEKEHVNAIDAAAAGASEGMRLAINVAAMLIAFLAFLALIDYLLGQVDVEPKLSLARLFSWIFSPLALLLGVEGPDIPRVADLLGTKLAANEFVAYAKLTSEAPTGYAGQLAPRSHTLATYALTGFANFASIGVQLGGIGAMAPERRPDLAKLAGRALFVGFLATLVNAAIAGVLLPAPA